MVTATIKDKTYKMLYDTGSCITCMSKEMLQEILEANVKIQKIKTPPKQFTSANGGKLQSIGMYRIPIQIEGKLIQTTFQVLPKLHENFILGIDFIKEKQLHLCIRHHQFHWDDECPLDHDRRLIVKEEITIPPQASKLCKVQVIDANDQEEMNYVAEISIPSQPWIQGAPTLIRNNGQGKLALVELFNSSLVPRVITRNKQIGNAENLDPSRILSINEVTTAISADTHPTKEILHFITKNAKVEGSKEEKEKYLKLFYKYPQVFSQHKNDLGRCDLVQHQIHLKTKEPVYIKQFKIPEGHQKAVTDQVKEWLKLGIVQSSHSRYNSPIFVVKKKDGSFRLVQDFRALNQQTYIDKYSMRDVTDCIHEIGRSESTIFSTIDLTSGFWQMVL